MTDVQAEPRARGVADESLCRLLIEDMLFARRASERFWNLQRQGRLATVPPLTGQEAAVVGVVRGLDLATDWFVPYYRDLIGLGALGDEFFEQIVAYWRGHPDGGHIPEGVRCLPPQIALGSQIPHAAGLAWGLALRGDPGVVCTFIGDGATSEGDFYEGINLAGVQRVPLIVVCINNGWAISTPTDHQTAAESFAIKGEAAGIPGVRVDGNDVLAVVDATRAARRRATAGDGPTLLEVVTYRMGAHTNSDDPSRYVPPETLTDWKERDPIERFREVLQRAELWDDDQHAAALERADARLERIIDAALQREIVPADALDHVVATPSTRASEQRAEIVRRSAPGDARGDARGDAPAGDTEAVSWRA